MVSGPLGPMEPVLSAEERGSVTPAHRQLISTLTRSQELEWSGVALLSCLRWLCTSTLTEAPEVQVDGAWTDGSDAFCVVYRVPYGPPRGVGFRCHRADGNPIGTIDSDGDDSEPVEFGRQVADFEIGEPLGSRVTRLRRDEHGVGWWGSLGDDLPVRSSMHN